jgi:hypothetical protein
MRRLLFVVALAGCTHAATTGPQWPKAQASDHDGGESIAPREGAKSVAAAPDKDDDNDETPTSEAAPAAAAGPAATTEGGAPAAAAPAATDDVIQTEEIVIEVGPDD